MAELEALLHDHIECGKRSAAKFVAKAQAVSELDLLRAMFDVGYRFDCQWLVPSAIGSHQDASGLFTPSSRGRVEARSSDNS